MEGKLVICIVIFVLSLISYALNKIPMAITALGTMAALILTGCLDGATAMSGFANTNMAIIVGMFVIAAGFNRTQFVDKLTVKIAKLAGGSYKKAYLFSLIFMIIITSLLNSASVALVIVLPLYAAMCKQFNVSPSKGVFGLFVLSVGCSGVLPFGTAVMLSGQFNGFFETYGFTDYTISPMTFTLGRLPVILILFLWAYFILPKFAPDTPPVPITGEDSSKKEKTPLKPFQETMGYVLFFGSVLLMIFGGKIGIPAWQVCLVGAVLEVALGVLTEKEAINAMPISIAMMFAGALAMGNALSATGAAQVVGDWLASVVGGTHNNYVLAALFFIVPFVLTQFMLNQAVTNIFVPIMLLTMQSLGGNPTGLAVIIPSACMTAFLTPMATPGVPIAMAWGGYDIKSLFKQGWLISIILAIFYIAYTLTVLPAF